MSFFVGGAVLATTAYSAYSAKKGAKENSKGIQKGLDQSAEIANQARKDVINLFDSSSKKANIGLQSALDFYKQNAQKRIQPFMQGNQAAQNVIGIGANQANNAILGLPVDINAMSNQPQVQADYSGIQGAMLPPTKAGYSQDGDGQLQVGGISPVAPNIMNVNQDIGEAERRAMFNRYGVSY